MVHAHRVVALEPLVAQQVREAVRQHVEVHGALVVIQEEGVVEGLGLAGLAQELRVAGDPVQDQVGEDRLLLLPPGLAIVPGEPVEVLAFPGRPLDDVVPAAAELVRADRRHDLPDVGGRLHVLGLGEQGMDAHQVPGDLEVVAHDGAILLPGVDLVVGPVLVEALLHEGAVLVVPEPVEHRVERRAEHPGMLLGGGRQVEVDQVRGRVVADGVPVLARAVGAERLMPWIEEDRVDVREVAALGPVEEEPFHQPEGGIDVLLDPGVRRDAVRLRRPGEGVDLLVHRHGIVVVGEFRGE